MTEPRLVREIIHEIMDRLRELEAASESVDALLSCREAAAYLGRTAGTVSRYIAQGRLHKVVRNGRIGVLRSECRKLKKSHRV